MSTRIQNHLGDGPLSMMGDDLKLTEVGSPAHRGQHHSLAGILNSTQFAFVLPCFLPMKCVSLPPAPASMPSFCTGSQNKHCLPWIVFVNYFITANKQKQKQMKTMPFDLWSVLRQGLAKESKLALSLGCPASVSRVLRFQATTKAPVLLHS